MIIFSYKNTFISKNIICRERGKGKMSKERVFVSVFSFFKPLFFWVVLVLILSEHVNADRGEQSFGGLGPLVKKNQRRTIISTEFGEVSEATVTDGNEAFQLHFITLEPNSLFLPVLLHSDMVFYVQTGSGRLSYIDEDDKENRKLRRGDIHRLRSGASFFIQSDLETDRQKLRIIAIFDNSECGFNLSASGAYSSISDMILGFDDRVLGETFKASKPVIEEIKNATRPGAIIHGLQKKKNTIWDTEFEFMEELHNIFYFSNKHKKSKLFNILGEDPDFQNCNGWSTTVNGRKYRPLRGSKYGVFMVNLNTGSMMGPHWNPVATEIAIGVKGRGMTHVVCPRIVNVSKCKNARYEVEEGDVFVVPRFHPMAQMAFNNETFVFMGFSTSARRNHPQYLAGKDSALRTLDKRIVAASLGVDDATLEKFLAQQHGSVILACKSCAEEEWMRMVEEIEKERQEEREREEEEARRKEEEKRREEEEARRKEEEEAQKKREEEEAMRKWAEEWKRWQEEEARRKEEEEAQKKREEEEAQTKREEEEVTRKWAEEWKRWQEEQRERQEQEQRERQEQEERERQEEQQRQQEKEERQEQQRRWEEEERKRQEEQRRQEQEERERQEQQQREQAQEAEREREEQARREEEAAKEAAQGQGEGGTEGQGQWGEGQAGVPEGERGQEAETGQGGTEGQGQWGEGQGGGVPEGERGQEAETGQGQGGTEGQGHWGEGQGGVPEEERGQEAEAAAQWWERAHGSEGRGQQEAAQGS